MSHCSIAAHLPYLGGTHNSAFYVQFESHHGEKWHIRTHTCLVGATRAPVIYLMHLIKVLKHFIGNACLSLQCTIPFAVLGRYPNLAFCVQYESRWQWKIHSETHTCPVDVIRSPSHLLYASKKGDETLHKHWLSPLLAVYHHYFHTRRGYQKCSIFKQLESQSQWEMAR